VKPNSVIRTLFAAFLITLFCLGNPVFAADSSASAVNSYRKNLSRLRPTIESPVSEESVSEESVSEESVSDQAFFARIFNNKFAKKNISAATKPSPYAVIAAARKTSHRPVFASPSFAKQLPQQLSKLLTGLQEQPVRVLDAIKTALSEALDQAGAKAHQTAEQLRQR
jgi:hypothetical protein